jgi:excinuclease ABC subunit A
VHGGEVIAFGTPEDLMANENSITGKYLSGERRNRRSRKRRWADKKKMIKVIGATGNNLKNVTAEIPAGHLHLRHRRVGRRQVHADHRDAVQGRSRGV